MKKSYMINVLIGTLSGKLKMPYKEIKDRLDNPEKYYKVNTPSGGEELSKFFNAVEAAEQELWAASTEYGKKNQAYPKDSDYSFAFCQTRENGSYFCIYTLMDIIPS